MTEKWPTSSELTRTTLIVLSRLGASANVADLYQGIIDDIKLSPALLEIKRTDNRGEIQYRLAWVRTKAKQNGLITKELNRHWKITDKGLDLVNKQ